MVKSEEMAEVPEMGTLRTQHDPLGTCPPGRRSYYEKMATRATEGSLRACIKLKCLECCAWYLAEVRKCEIHECALWGTRLTGLKRVDGK